MALSSASIAVDKATSDLLIAPDWTMNMDICDAVNTNRWPAKDAVKAVKRRLQHKSSRVQLLSLTLLETMVKNCGEYVHLLIVERNILAEMVKIVKKKADMQVRDTILVLLDSWQEAFGGPGGKHPQFYWAFDELRRSGVEFPPRESNSALIFTPPVTHPIPRHAQAGFGMPSNSPRRLDEAMATEPESLSLSSLESMRNANELLNDMLQAVNPSDRTAVKDEVIVDLVERCRSNQKKLMNMLTTTGDEALLFQGLELNDVLQGLLAKHDAIAAGLPIPDENRTPVAFSSQPTTSGSGPKPTEEVRVSDLSTNGYSNPGRPVTAVTNLIDEEEEEDDFAQLARRHSKARYVAPQSMSPGTTDSFAIVNTNGVAVSSAPAPALNPCTDLVLPDPPAPVKTKEQEIIDLLSITLTTTSPQAPTGSNPDMHQVPISPTVQGHQPFGQPAYPGNQGEPPYGSYVVPWAQPEPQVQSHGQHHQPQPQVQSYSQYQHPPPQQPRYDQPQYSQQSYPPPPWAGTYTNQGPSHASPNAFYTPRPSATTSYTPMQPHNSFPSIANNGLPVQGDARTAYGPRNPAPGSQKLFMPSSRLFEDLNVLGNAEEKHKMGNSASSSLSGNGGQSMVGGRK